MELEWDEKKRLDTLQARGLDFADVVDFDFASASTVEDNRSNYNEVRRVSIGYLHGRLCVLCWTERRGRLRVISLRKANDREKQKYSSSAG